MASLLLYSIPFRLLSSKQRIEHHFCLTHNPLLKMLYKSEVRDFLQLRAISLKNTAGAVRKISLFFFSTV